ncbi:hypothetical protein PN478_12375 [Dolichospermum circinale CS-534/05]|uniref:calcium-binding protein n=1 Tax=Dolichospermum circinale TaxID=109265 RepID=UPI00232B7BEC|nr:hypothetical protein [Dolichospermum circinale]MDB9491313.1 hypothetical protein [Dolichospermum circinale CS-534/05]
MQRITVYLPLQEINLPPTLSLTLKAKTVTALGVRTTDQDGLSFEKQLTISINNVTENDNDNLTTTPQQDIIDAQGGDDTISSTFANLQQNDTIKGGNGTDTLIITGGTANDIISINTNNTTNQLNIPGTTVFGFERFDLTSFAGTISFNGTTGDDWIKAGTGNDYLIGGLGNDTMIGGVGSDTLYLGLNDNVVDNVNYVLGDGTDTVYQFVRGVGGDRLNFTGIANFDVIRSGNSTLVRVGDGIADNAGFGTGQLLVTLSGTSGFNRTNVNLNLFGGTFLFS